MPKIFTSYDQVSREYLKNDLLIRLKEKICAYLNLDQQHQYKLTGSEFNPRVGVMEFTRPDFFSGTLNGLIEEFYKEEGFEIKKNMPLIEVKNDAEEYWVHVQNHSDAFLIWIHESLVPKERYHRHQV